jgi:hypothetical protein
METKGEPRLGGVGLEVERVEGEEEEERGRKQE